MYSSKYISMFFIIYEILNKCVMIVYFFACCTIDTNPKIAIDVHNAITSFIYVTVCLIVYRRFMQSNTQE